MIKLLNKIVKSENKIPAFSLFTLQIGQEIAFAHMQQPDVSHSSFLVSDSVHYQFGSESFTAWLLRRKQETLSLIATPTRISENYAIALAKKIDEKLFSALFSTNVPEKWFSFANDTRITTSNRVMGMQQSWIANDYTLILREKATCIQQGIKKHFDYLLFVNGDNTLALEAEKYSDGTIEVYCTVYCDESAIKHIGLMRKVPLRIVTDKSDATKIATQEKILLHETLLEKLQAEAKLNRMSIENLVRKVIDIPVETEDNISPYFILNEEERIMLAKRYAVPVSDRKALRQKILDDLNSFVGNR